MIKFITKNLNHQVVEEDEILQIQEEITDKESNFIKSLKFIGYDLETTELDPYKAEILLLIIGDKETQLVIDVTTVDPKPILDLISDDIVFLAANGKFDNKFTRIKYNRELKKIFDVMLAEQRLVQGTGLSASLEAIQERRLNILSNKNVRTEFIGANPSTFVFKNRHIIYGANDIKNLFDIREKQKEKIAERDMQRLVYEIEFPLSNILANAELTGMNINEKKWIENVNVNKEAKFKVECELDEELRRLRDAFLPVKERVFLSNGRFDRVRKRAATVSIDTLFGEDFDKIEVDIKGKEKKTTKIKSPYINYDSGTELLNIMARLHQPVPTIDLTTKQPGEPEIPTFKISKGKEVVNKDRTRFTLGAPAVESFIIENPNSPMKAFLEKIVKYREYCNSINSFGEEFLKKNKNLVTKRFHTIYRQCAAVTSRLQSGGGKKEPDKYNSQNIPAEKHVRECFHFEDEDIITTDLSGAEAVIMIDKAHDEKFYELAIVNDDAHSPLATSVWRAIGRYRIEKGISKNQEFTKEDMSKIYFTPYQLSQITISKKENKFIRTVFKNSTFATIYGCGAKKYAKILNISIEEAKIGLQVMKAALPKTFKMVEDNEKFALANGYLILNTRTNSRIWYPKILEARQYGFTLKDEEVANIKSSARNAAIQGTQADMLKEIMVEIDKESKRQKLDEKYGLALLKQVHDETVYKSRDAKAIVEFIPDRKVKSTVITGEGINVHQVVTYEMVTIAEFIKKWHIQVCNRYLTFIKMSAEQHVGKTWTK